MKRLLIGLILLFSLSSGIGYAKSTSSLTYDEYILGKAKIIGHAILDEKAIYDEILNAIQQLEPSVNLSQYGTFDDGQTMAALYFKVLEEHPELFYVSNTIYWNGTSQSISLNFDYLYSTEEARNKIDEFEEKVTQITGNLINPNMSELEKELALHDYILLNTEYETQTITDESYTAYGVLMNGRGVCMGYAKAMQLLLNRVGIDAIYVRSPQMNHGWNIVTIDGQKYHLDVTWNDPIPDKKGRLRYKYFNLSDEEMSVNHVWNTEIYPTCSSNRFKYLEPVRESVVVQRYKKYFYYRNQDRYLVKLKFDGSEDWVTENQITSDLWLDGSLLCYKDQETYQSIEIDLKFDLNEDSWININDLEFLAPYYQREDLSYDFNGDEIIDLYDFVLLSWQI